MDKPTNPMEQMHRLDGAGTAYTVTLLLLGGATLEDCDVYSHTLNWLQVKPNAGQERIWVQTRNILLLEVTER